MSIALPSSGAGDARLNADSSKARRRFGLGQRARVGDRSLRASEPPSTSGRSDVEKGSGRSDAAQRRTTASASACRGSGPGRSGQNRRHATQPADDVADDEREGPRRCRREREATALDSRKVAPDEVHLADRRARFEEGPDHARLILDAEPVGREREQRRRAARNQREQDVSSAELVGASKRILHGGDAARARRGLDGPRPGRRCAASRRRRAAGRDDERIGDRDRFEARRRRGSSRSRLCPPRRSERARASAGAAAALLGRAVRDRGRRARPRTRRSSEARRASRPAPASPGLGPLAAPSSVLIA